MSTAEMEPGDLTIDADAGTITARPFAIAHHHIYSALARGMPPPHAAPTNFVEVLERIWWKLDRNLDLPMIRASARVVGVEAARRGCGFVIDHHSSPNAAEGSLESIGEALDEVGVGHLPCIELSDRDGPASRDAGFGETERCLAERPALVGLHASFTVSDETLERAVGLAREHGTGVHIHVAEAASDQEHCETTHGVRVIERLERAGALDLDKTLLIHAIHLDERERAILRDKPCWVVQCTESNQNNAVGRFDPRGLSDRILVGTDGMHSDPLRTIQSAYFDAQSTGGLSPADAWRRLTRVNDYLARFDLAPVGDDAVVLDYPRRAPTPVTDENVHGHAMYGMTGGDVATLRLGGQEIVRDRELVTVDVDEILANARVQAKRLWDRL